MIQETRDNKVTIFNRWGDLVFTVNNYNNTTNVFSGKNSNGNELPSGTYFYRIEYTAGNRPSETGYLSLKR
jgi:gliding motility-associated-like protein